MLTRGLLETTTPEPRRKNTFTRQAASFLASAPRSTRRCHRRPCCLCTSAPLHVRCSYVILLLLCVWCSCLLYVMYAASCVASTPRHGWLRRGDSATRDPRVAPSDSRPPWVISPPLKNNPLINKNNNPSTNRMTPPFILQRKPASTLPSYHQCTTYFATCEVRSSLSILTGETRCALLSGTPSGTSGHKREKEMRHAGGRKLPTPLDRSDTANLRTKILDLRGFDSSIILI